ncbi:SURF1 family protein [Variovorax sp. OV700]|uniref:SURF1 family protein n=1 Tax=Variovorax sp. OV700 TaxID=1882826 RepID=UPI000886EE59|nr:SURF1 family protein [Variovorax sp. OV700]SDH95028.1 surfeit locus 1 family protein [Variovorax sp. OV700]
MTPPPPDHSTPSLDTPAGRQRSAAARAALAVCAALAFAGFFALGTWQVERRAWKLDLIARVEQRVHAAPADAPGRERWPQVNAADDEYRRVRLAGTFLHDKETLVQASTRLGAGFWVLTPLRAADGSIVLVNRGFVPPDAQGRSARAATEPQGETTVTGLLRITEPHGGFLRKNEPAAQRWFSRDVQAIAAAHGLGNVAPYFVDSDAAPSSSSAAPAWPAGGLTVIAFPNSHLVYAITWYGLALMVLGAAGYAWREGHRRRNGENAANAQASARPDAHRD